MKYQFAVAALLLSLQGQLSHAYSIMGAGFYAPSYNGKANVIDPEVGAIIFDSSDGTFYGRTNTSTWSAFSIPSSYWRVDANISGGLISLGTSNQTSYIGLDSSALTLTQNSGSITTNIPCSSTNAPTGTTCSTGNESIGVSFDLPRAGDVMACVSFMHYFDTPAGTGATEIQSVFQIVETPTNAQTISQEGKSRIQSGAKMKQVSGESVSITHPLRVCGTFNFGSTGTKVLRLMYEQYASSGNQNYIFADASSSFGQRDIHWEVYPLGY